MVKSGKSYLVIPHENWPGTLIYYYCPNCSTVFRRNKDEDSVCPDCRKKRCEDIFKEIDNKLSRIWDFFNATLCKEGPWGRFRFTASDEESYSLWATLQAMSLYGELRAAGIEPTFTIDPDAWIDIVLVHLNGKTGLIDYPENEREGKVPDFVKDSYYISRAFDSTLTNRLFISGRYSLPLEKRILNDPFSGFDDALQFLEDPKMETDPWGHCSHIARGILNHVEILKQEGHSDDGMSEFVRRWLEKKQNPDTGFWGGKKASLNNAANGVMKLFTVYDTLNWPIPRMKKIVDTTHKLQTSKGDWGSKQSGCSVFDPLFNLWVIRKRIPDYRVNDINEAAAKCFINFKEYWSKEEHFFIDRPGCTANWDGKHAMATPLYMAQLILGQEYFGKASSLNNWRVNKKWENN